MRSLGGQALRHHLCLRAAETPKSCLYLTAIYSFVVEKGLPVEWHACVLLHLAWLSPAADVSAATPPLYCNALTAKGAESFQLSPSPHTMCL